MLNKFYSVLFCLALSNLNYITNENRMIYWNHKTIIACFKNKSAVTMMGNSNFTVSMLRAT